MWLLVQFQCKFFVDPGKAWAALLAKLQIYTFIKIAPWFRLRSRSVLRQSGGDGSRLPERGGCDVVCVEKLERSVQYLHNRIKSTEWMTAFIFFFWQQAAEYSSVWQGMKCLFTGCCALCSFFMCHWPVEIVENKMYIGDPLNVSVCHAADSSGPPILPKRWPARINSDT